MHLNLVRFIQNCIVKYRGHFFLRLYSMILGENCLFPSVQCLREVRRLKNHGVGIRNPLRIKVSLARGVHLVMVLISGSRDLEASGNNKMRWWWVILTICKPDSLVINGEKLTNFLSPSIVLNYRYSWCDGVTPLWWLTCDLITEVRHWLTRFWLIKQFTQARMIHT